MIRPFDGCREKIVRAREHLAQLERELTPGPDNQLYRIVTEHVPNTGKYVIHARFRDEAFVRWGVMSGEIAHDLRSALDHAVCAIARRTNPNLDCEGMSFPIYTTPLGTGEHRRELTGLSNAQAEAVIESVQPHVLGYGAQRHPLYALHRLNIWDKHRDIAIGVVSLKIEPDWDAPGEPFRGATSDAEGRALNDGTTLLTVTVADPRGVDMKGVPAIFVRFAQPSPTRPEPFADGLPVPRLLDDMIRTVEDVLTQLAPFEV